MVIRPKIYIERNKSYVKTLKIAANPQRNKISKKYMIYLVIYHYFIKVLN